MRRSTLQKWIILIAMLGLLAWFELGDLWRTIFAWTV